MKAFTVIFLFFSYLFSYGQKYNVAELAQMDMNSGLSGLWGYVDKTGKEYALVGLVNGSIAVVDVSNGVNPKEVYRADGETSIWREVKVYNHRAYVVTEANGGVQIVDLSTLPENPNLTKTTFTDGGKLRSTHTLWIDEDGLMYLWGSNAIPGKEGYLVYDLKVDPINPPLYHTQVTPYIHDGLVFGDRMYLSHIYTGYFSIYDVSDKKNPVFLGSQITPNQFTHNAWPSEDKRYLFTTDEKPNSYLTSYSIVDPTNIIELDRIQTAPGSNAIIHNTHVLGDYAISSYYTEGITIHDITDPENLIEVGKYDCSLFSGGTTNGVWEVFPYFPSGRLIAGDREGGLFVFQPVYKKGCYIHGEVVDGVSGDKLSGVNIEIAGLNINASSKHDGKFKTGYAIPGNTTLKATKPGYNAAYAANLVIRNGDTTTVHIKMFPVGTGIQGNEANQIALYPNPSSSSFTLDAGQSGAELVGVTIRGASGEIVKQLSNLNVGGSTEFGADLAPGVYFVQITFDTGEQQFNRLIKI